MTLAELVNQFRVLADDLAEPFLWSDDEVVAYLNDAVNEACVRAKLIEDHDSPFVCHLHLRPGQADYRLHPAVCEVLRAYADDEPLCHAEMDDVLRAGRPWYKHTGTPRLFITPEQGLLRVHPTPDKAAHVELEVYRVPIHGMKKGADEPDIPAMYHYRLLDWALHRAYSKRDADAQDQSRAAAHQAAFEFSFGYRHSADTRRRQLRHRPPVVRPAM